MCRQHLMLSVRCAGTSANARRTVSLADIAWASVILLTEEKHKTRLIHVLDMFCKLDNPL